MRCVIVENCREMVFVRDCGEPVRDREIRGNRVVIGAKKLAK